MRLYSCPQCGDPVYFENLSCSCGTEIAYDPDSDRMVADYAPCEKRPEIGCNWSAAPDAGDCRSCAMTVTHPDLTVARNLELWSRSEAAKRWVLSNLMSLGWFGSHDEGRRPTFHLLAEKTARGAAQPVMGHADGEITINVAEADPVEIIRRRERMGEPYRTMIGHYRHELAHFLFARLSANPAFLEAFRDQFGDETSDYGQALKRYYETGAPDDWIDRHISAYATSHPHEDWAETAAHVLHLIDVVDSAYAAGLREGSERPNVADTGKLLSEGIDLGLALNHVNRSMGLGDVYPFVITPIVHRKLAFAHRSIVAGPETGTHKARIGNRLQNSGTDAAWQQRAAG